MRSLLGVLATCALLAPVAQAQEPDPVETGRALLGQLRPGHPRLMVTDESLAVLQATIARDATAADWYAKLLAVAEKTLPEPPIERVLIGPRLLDKSRKCLSRVATWGLVYRLGGDRRFLERAKQELLTAAAFDDWNPSHFLDTAEMTHALAIGYDWLYADLTDAERAAIRAALVEKGLRLGEKAYTTRPMAWWTSCRHNWNQVCNGGLGIGALALADEEPELAALVLGKAVTLMPNAMREYGPDGGWAEGPGYWGYATAYTVYFLAALETATGSDGGLCAIPGFAEAGDFRIRFVGPTGQTFNYADAGSGAGTAPCMLWLGRRFGRVDYLAHEVAAVQVPSPWDLLWYSEGAGEATAGPKPLDCLFQGVHVAFLRSHPSDPEATFLGLKGGDNRANHSHLDLGTFVLDALGVRWAEDLGSDNYNLPGYFGKQRWEYFRLRTESHNTLALDDQNQVERAVAPIVDFATGDAGGYAVVDLTAAYAPTCTKVLRRIDRVEQTHVWLHDTIEAPEGIRITWAMLTRARVEELRGATALLSRGDGPHLRLTVTSPAEARWEALEASPAPPQAQNADVTKLALRLTTGAEPLRIAVEMTPFRGEAPPLSEEPTGARGG